jgi:hypothetical protein
MNNHQEELTENENKLLKNICDYYNLSLKVLRYFGGPSIYFHVQSIKEQRQQINFLSDRHIEMIYATLASWGMHRMGAEARMVEFPVFKNSILGQRDQLQQFYDLKMKDCTIEQYQGYIDNLQLVYNNLSVTTANATIVAHSKTLAHILPNLIPPLDRQYTVRFFTQDNENFFNNAGGYKNIYLPKRPDAQFADFKKYCCKIKRLFDQINQPHPDLLVKDNIENESFNTSIPKIMDNLIIAFVKNVPRPNNAQGKNE